MGKIKKGTFEDGAYGCILGGMVADACGSYLEFSIVPNKQDQVQKCMQMPGGGPHLTGPGQPTDDSEMAYCIILALIDSNLSQASSIQNHSIKRKQSNV